MANLRASIIGGWVLLHFYHYTCCSTHYDDLNHNRLDHTGSLIINYDAQQNGNKVGGNNVPGHSSELGKGASNPEFSHEFPFSMSKISGEGETAVEHLIQVLINHMHFQLSAYGNCLFASSENELDVKRSPGLLMKYLAVEDCALQVRSLQALGYVLISRHEYMLENDIGKILEGTLSDVANDRLKWYFIQFYTC
ncbi:sister chromatid cohesion protein SCC2 [Trifolium repens]|nr:sister chromatid cohesion protein SCC2 [Trifolium repens]